LAVIRITPADLKWTYRGKSKSKVFDPHCRYEGDAVAGIAADSPYSAQSALKAIKVEYEVLPFVSDERQALDPTAVTIHEKGNLVDKPEVYLRGDVEKGIGEADIVLETNTGASARSILRWSCMGASPNGTAAA
jgi:xanthine dehydrogenase YagR molybdenum-binding subunit